MVKRVGKRTCKFLVNINLILILLFSAFVPAKAASPEGDSFNPGEMIMHHIEDSHVWHFWDGPYGTLYLPIILYTEGRGLQIFSSKNFYDDQHALVEYDGYRYDHGHIGPITGDAHIWDFSITKNVASMFISVALMVLVFISIANSYKKNQGKAPKGIQSFFEPLILFIRDDIAKPNIQGEKHKKYLPYLLTIFFFIWFNNLLGLLPGAANVTGNIAITFTLAFFTFLITVFSGNKHYWAHIFNTPGVPWWLKWGVPIMPVVEFIGIFTKPFSLMVRLFANITAGHIIILSLFSLIFIFRSIAIGPLSVAFATFMYFLELFVAFLQAYIFTLLSAMYFGAAVEEHHDHAPESEHVDQALI